MVTVTGLPAVALRVVGSKAKSLVARFRVTAPPAFEAALVAVVPSVVAEDLLLPPPPQPASTSPVVAAISTAVIHLRPRIDASLLRAVRGSCPRWMTR